MKWRNSKPSKRHSAVFCLQAGLVAAVWGLSAAYPPVAGTAQAAEQALLEVKEAADPAHSHRFHEAEILAMPQHVIRTSSEWTDGKVDFKGPLVRDFLTQRQRSDYENVLVVAANDYRVSIPLSDFLKYDVILALEMDGERLTLRDKGPLWIVYPRDDHPELKTAEMNARWVWQVVEIRLE